MKKNNPPNPAQPTCAGRQRGRNDSVPMLVGVGKEEPWEVAYAAEEYIMGRSYGDERYAREEEEEEGSALRSRRRQG